MCSFVFVAFMFVTICWKIKFYEYVWYKKNIDVEYAVY